MGYIKISTADADKMLAYVRKELECRKEGFNFFLEQATQFADNEIRRQTQSGLDPNGMIGTMIKDIALSQAREDYQKRIETLVSFVEILTCGSAELEG